MEDPDGGFFWPCGEDEIEQWRGRVAAEVKGLIALVDMTPANFIIVSNEVGLGVVPANPLARAYRDILGEANQKIAGRADEVCFMVAGIPVPIKKRDEPE